MQYKDFDELTIQDNFIFQKVMRNKRICKMTLERLLDIDIKDISYPEEEKAIDVRLDSKSIRLDVYVNDDKGTVFNVEMQTSKNMKELVKRARFYQGMIDIDLIEKGQSYESLNETYIIFICPFKMFDGLRHKYTFNNICIENGHIHLEDGTNKVFLSTKGTLDDIPKPLKAFLDYIDGGVPEDDFVREIDLEVDKVKHCEDWRREYMTLQIELDQRWRAGLAEGFNQGKAEGFAAGISEGESRGRAAGIIEGEARGRAEGETYGMIKTLYTLVKSNVLTIDKAAHQANVTEEEFIKMIENL